MLREPLLVTTPPPSRRSWLVPTLAVFACANVGLLVSVLRLSAELSTLKSQTPPAPAVLASCASSPLLPHKVLLDGLTPSADQMNRGDCYLFSMTGILEDSYRRYGAARGWIDPGTFVRFSRQAMGVNLAHTCAADPNSYCPANIVDGGAVAWGATVEGEDGADEHLLYYLRKLGAEHGALPDAVCAYDADADAHELECDGLAAAAPRNPLRFTTKSFESFYDIYDVKRALHERRRPLTLGLSMAENRFRVPCTAAAGCTPSAETCVACPTHADYGGEIPRYGGEKCCTLITRPMVSMKGEWRVLTPTEGPMVLEGGHAINIVGYTDGYRDDRGNVGGFIVRNTWADGIGKGHGSDCRGSHTAAFFYGGMGDTDEAIACPNLHSPRSWFPAADLRFARSPLATVEAAVAGKALRLKCLDSGAYLPAGACDPAGAYYLKNSTEYGADGLVVHCFLRDADDGGPTELCLPPLLFDDASTVFTPEDVKENDRRLCGYNFMSYVTYDALMSRFGGTTVSDFDIEWEPSAYAKNKAGKYDYSLVEKSTETLAKLPRFKPLDSEQLKAMGAM